MHAADLARRRGGLGPEHAGRGTFEGNGVGVLIKDAMKNVVEPGHFSNSTDVVVDETTDGEITSPAGSNVCTETAVPAYGSIRSCSRARSG